MIIIKKLKTVVGGLFIGIINGLFGAGGGMIAVPLLKSSGMSQKEAQASAIAIILPLSILSSAVYLYKGYLTIGDAIGYIPFGILGTVIGTNLMKKISNNILKIIFSGFMLWAGIRMIFR